MLAVKMSKHSICILFSWLFSTWLRQRMLDGMLLPGLPTEHIKTGSLSADQKALGVCGQLYCVLLYRMGRNVGEAHWRYMSEFERAEKWCNAFGLSRNLLQLPKKYNFYLSKVDKNMRKVFWESRTQCPQQLEHSVSLSTSDIATAPINVPLAV